MATGGIAPRRRNGNVHSQRAREEMHGSNNGHLNRLHDGQDIEYPSDTQRQRYKTADCPRSQPLSSRAGRALIYTRLNLPLPRICKAQGTLRGASISNAMLQDDPQPQRHIANRTAGIPLAGVQERGRAYERNKLHAMLPSPPQSSSLLLQTIYPQGDLTRARKTPWRFVRVPYHRSPNMEESDLQGKHVVIRAASGGGVCGEEERGGFFQKTLPFALDSRGCFVECRTDYFAH